MGLPGWPQVTAEEAGTGERSVSGRRGKVAMKRKGSVGRENDGPRGSREGMKIQ